MEETARRRWEEDIRIDVREIVWEDVDWSLLAQDRNQWLAPVNRLIIKDG